MAKANAKRVEATRQEAFAAGYKLEKKVKAASKEDRDRGVAWGASTFSNGVVKVNKRDLLNPDKAVDTKALLRGAQRRPSMGNGGKKKLKKGSKKKGAGKKSKR